jgi:four helix bundle protein
MVEAVHESDLHDRTKAFGLRTIKLVDALPNTHSGRAVANQLIRCALSIGANYRAACSGRSKAEFIAKLGVVREEADESVYWLEIIIGSNLVPETRVAPLLKEATELTAIFTSSIISAKRNKQPNSSTK